MDHDPGVRKRIPLALRPGREEDRTHAGRLPHAISCHGAFQELHGVINGKAGRNRTTRRIDVHVDVFIRVLTLEEKHLCNRKVADLVGDRRSDEDDAVLQQS